MVIERGQIYWCALDPIQGHEQGATRPVIVVSADAYNKTQSPLAAVVPLTKAAAKTPLHLRFSQEDTGLRTESTVLIDHARFVDSFAPARNADWATSAGRTRTSGPTVGPCARIGIACLPRQGDHNDVAVRSPRGRGFHFGAHCAQRQTGVKGYSEEVQWSHPPGLNRRPADYESAALPTELGWLTFFDYNDLQRVAQPGLNQPLEWLYAGT